MLVKNKYLVLLSFNKNCFCWQWWKGKLKSDEKEIGRKKQEKGTGERIVINMTVLELKYLKVLKILQEFHVKNLYHYNETNIDYTRIVLVIAETKMRI